MMRAGVVGPIFVAMGSTDQLRKFLDMNPRVPREKMFVDMSADQDAYAALNLRTSFSEGKGNLQAQLPKSSEYLANLGSVNDLLPKAAAEGVKKMGGTFVLQGQSKIVLASAQRIPGDDASVNEVLRSVGA